MNFDHIKICASTSNVTFSFSPFQREGRGISKNVIVISNNISVLVIFAMMQIILATTRIRKQVEKITWRLKDKNITDMMVGTTEEFQAEWLIVFFSNFRLHTNIKLAHPLFNFVRLVQNILCLTLVLGTGEKSDHLEHSQKRSWVHQV